ncbi:NADPH-dependent FMN reductase [Paractinoplanes rhizophilus]|jgi:NAD(P)H-dependent FMN reductase|uniref:NADPH-dependent FMN reductase n=1 Tax=Paractinoplanes rhizophilus TaxID=1416877 RepID=A0ABW2HPX7_9ACTN
MTRLLLISGNTRADSLHTAALRTAARFAPAGISASLFDGLRDLPAFVPGEYSPPDAISFLRLQVAAADAVLFSTPEFAGSIPGSLKNLLDWLVDGGDLTGKPAAWLSVAVPGQDDGACAALETVLGHCGANVLTAACVRIPLTQSAMDPHGTVADPHLHQALLDLLQTMTRALAAPKPSAQPSWQAVSSLYPVVQRNDATPFRSWRAEIWRPGE